MRYLILSDLHANEVALKAVLAAAGADHDGLLCLGDLVDYGARPNEVIAAVRALPGLLAVRGNHDRVAAGLASPAVFSPDAQAASAWTATQLSPASRDFLRALPPGPRGVEGEEVAICHGAPHDEDAYLASGRIARDAFAAHPARIVFFGHTHVASLFSLCRGRLEAALLAGEAGGLELDPHCRYLVNPGSVGQPRDGDPRAAFLRYDSTAGILEWRRVAYDIAVSQEQILAAGLPAPLAGRLALGV